MSGNAPAVVVGEALVDVIVDAQGEVTSVIGGAPLNTARTVCRLGERADFLGGISTDALGRRIQRLLDADGVHAALAQPTDAPTTLAIAQLDDGGAATYRFLLDGTSAAVVTPELALSAIDPSCRVLHVGTLGLVLQPLADASVALVQAAPADRLVMVDPNFRPSVMQGSAVFDDALHAVLDRADVVKVSGDDLGFLFPELPKLDAAMWLHRDADVVVLFTDGADAVHVIVGGKDIVIDVPQVPVVDTVGAGDSFSGGVIAWWLRHGLDRAAMTDEQALLAATRYGIAVAGITCQRPGADPPRASEVPAL